MYILLKLSDNTHKWVKVALSSGTQTLINEEIYDSEHYDGWPEDVENGEVTFYNEELEGVSFGNRTTTFYYNAPNKGLLNRIFKQEQENVLRANSFFQTCVGVYLGKPDPGKDDNGVFLVAGLSGLSSDHFRVYASFDYGNNWHETLEASAQSEQRPRPFDFVNLGSGKAILFCWQANVNYWPILIYRTEDYGKTWSDPTWPGGWIPNLGTLLFPNQYGTACGNTSGKVCYVSKDGMYGKLGVMSSSDYGKTWDGPGSPANSCAINSYGNLLLGSGNYVSNSNGVTANLGSFVWRLFFVSENVALAGTSVGVKRTANGGESWSDTANSPNQVLNFTISGNAIIAITRYDTVWRSEDLGLSWYKVLDDPERQILSNRYWAAGSENGRCFKRDYADGINYMSRSNDSGETWSVFMGGEDAPLEIKETNYYLNAFDKTNIISSYSEKTDVETGETTYYQDIDYTLMEVARIGLSRYQSVNENQNRYSDWHDPLPFISVGGQTYLLVAKNGRNGEGEETHTLGFLNVDTRVFISTGRTSYDSTPLIYVAPDNSYALLVPDSSNPIMLFSNGDFSNTNFKRLINIDTIERRKTLMCAYFVSPSGPPAIIDYSPASPKVYAIDWKTYGSMPSFANNKIYASLSEGYYIYDGNIGKLMLTDFDEDDEPGDFSIPSFDGYAGKAWVKWYTVDDMFGSSALFEAPLIN